MDIRTFWNTKPLFRASLVVCNYNDFDLTKKCIDSILQFEPRNRHDYELIVVDDNSPDRNSVERLRNFCKENNFILVERSVNGGFPTAANTGMMASQGRMVILINNDVECLTPFIDAFEDRFKKDERIAVIGAKLIYPDNTIQHAGVSWQRGTLAHFPHVHKHQHKDLAEANTPGYFMSVTGAVYAIDSYKMRRCGLLNDDYPISFDDTEYSVSAWSRGFRVFYEPRVEAIHLEGYTRGVTEEQKLKKNTLYKEHAAGAFFERNMASYNLAFIQGLIDDLNRDLWQREGVYRRPEPTLPVQSQMHQPAVIAEPLAPHSVTRIVVKRTDTLGDVVFTTPIIRHLKKTKDNPIHVLTNHKDVYKHNPHIAGVHTPADFVIGAADQVFDLDLCYEMDPKKHIIDAYAQRVFGHTDLDKGLELFPDNEDIVRVQTLLNGLNIQRHRLVVLHAASSWRSKTWPQDKWQALVADLAKSYHVVVVGMAHDFKIGTAIPGLWELQGALTLQQMQFMIASASCFVTTDAELLPVAGATNTPIVALFMATKPEFRLPFRNAQLGDRCRPLTSSVECRGCLHYLQPPAVDFCKRGDFICLGEISPVSVMVCIQQFVPVPLNQVENSNPSSVPYRGPVPSPSQLEQQPGAGHPLTPQQSTFPGVAQPPSPPYTQTLLDLRMSRVRQGVNENN